MFTGDNGAICVAKGFDNIDYEEVAFAGVIGGVMGAKGGVNKGTAKNLMKQGVNATKRVWSKCTKQGLKAAGKELVKAGKYYFSQTATLYYKPLLVDSVRAIFREIPLAYVKSSIIRAS